MTSTVIPWLNSQIADLTRERDELHRLYAEALARGDEERREAEDELRVEVERLRAALEQIASAVFYAKQTPVEAKNLQDMAREALRLID